MSKIRVYGSRRKGTVLQPDLLASNGMIHIVGRLMDSVNPTVEGRPQVEPCPPFASSSPLCSFFALTLVVVVSPQENLMKIMSHYGKFDQFRTLLQVSTSCPAHSWLHPLWADSPPPEYRTPPTEF